MCCCGAAETPSVPRSPSPLSLSLSLSLHPHPIVLRIVLLSRASTRAASDPEGLQTVFGQLYAGLKSTGACSLRACQWFVRSLPTPLNNQALRGCRTGYTMFRGLTSTEGQAWSVDLVSAMVNVCAPLVAVRVEPTCVCHVIREGGRGKHRRRRCLPRDVDAGVPGLDERCSAAVHSLPEHHEWRRVESVCVFARHRTLR